MARSLPTFVGVGAMKGATTWLSECLRHHPEVFMSAPKELHFFSTDHKWDRGIDWYASHFEGSDGYKAVGEFSPSYLAVPSSLERMRSTFDDVHIIASLRNPVDRFLSDYKQRIRSGSFPPEARDLTLERYAWAIERKPRLLANGMYHDGLDGFMRVYGRERVHVVLQEDIAEDPQGVVRGLYAFLEVDPDFVPPIVGKRTSPGIVPRLQWLEDLRGWTFRRLNRLSPKAVVLIRKLRLAEIYRRMNHDGGAGSFKVDGDVREALRAYYAEDIDKLERLLGRPLDRWRHAAA